MKESWLEREIKIFEMNESKNNQTKINKLLDNLIFILRVKLFCPGMNELIWRKSLSISWMSLDSTCWQSISFLVSRTWGIILFINCLLVDQMEKVTCISQKVCNALRSQKLSEIICLFFIKLLLNRQQHTVGAEYHLGIPTLHAMHSYSALPCQMIWKFLL